jgi:ABC-type transport system substrate-binding protein
MKGFTTMPKIFSLCTLTGKKINLFALIIIIGSQMAYGKTLKVLMVRDGSSPYSELASGDVLGTFNKAVLGQLLSINDAFELQPELLKSWKWNISDNSYDLYLKENLTFQDGTPITSKDLEFALLRGFFSKENSFYEIYLGNILGVEKIKPSTAFSSGIVDGVKITGPLSIKVILKSPNPSFLYSLATPFFSFVEKSALKDDFLTWKKWPVGAGPYMVENETSEMISLMRNPSSSHAIDSPDSIILYKKDVANAEYDISYSPEKNLNQLYKSRDASLIYTLFFTNQNELSKCKDFRDAIATGINRKELIEADSASRPALSFLTSAHWHDQSIRDEYSLEKAKASFSRLPAHLKDKTWKIAVFSYGDFSEEKSRVVNNLKSQFAKFGFKTKFIPTDEKFLSKEMATECPLKFSGRVSDNVDPLLMYASFKTNSAYRYDNAQNDSVYDSLYEDASRAAGTEDRISTLKKLARYTIDKRFIVPLYEHLQLYHYSGKSIESFGTQNSSLILDLSQVRKK